MKQLTEHIETENELFYISDQNFDALALKIFRFQYNQNTFYRQYCDSINIRIQGIKELEQIPFLPIQFFKSKEIRSSDFVPGTVFESSGTTGSVTSRHFVKNTALYQESFLRSFSIFYGDITSFCIIGLLPSYLERKQFAPVNRQRNNRVTDHAHRLLM